LNPVELSSSFERLPDIHSIYPATAICMNHIGPITPHSCGYDMTVVPHV